MAGLASWFSSPTQVFWCCKALTDGREISHLTEISEAKGWRLAAIVWKLQHEFGWPIDTAYRGPDAIAHYRLRPGTDPAALRFPPSAAHLVEGGAA